MPKAKSFGLQRQIAFLFENEAQSERYGFALRQKIKAVFCLWSLRKETTWKQDVCEEKSEECCRNGERGESNIRLNYDSGRHAFISFILLILK